MAPSWQTAMTCAAIPVTVVRPNTTIASTLAAVIAIAAVVGRSRMSGTVAASASSENSTALLALPLPGEYTAAHANACTTPASASRPTPAARACGAAATRASQFGPIAVIVLRERRRRRPSHREDRASLLRGTTGTFGTPGQVPQKTALRRDDRGGTRPLAFRPMEATIEVAGLRKRFGSAQALDGMSFSVRPGQVTGFVGPNGAGKSTTMRVILGLDAADEGTALIGGQPYHALRQPLSHVGALLDAAALQPSRSARNHLLWLAHSQGLRGSRVDEVLRQAGLTSVAKRKAGGYSLGMRQRLGIAGALLGDPPVLMMDEPFNGMDPEGIVWMRGFLKALAAEGRAVLVSSHLMSELEDTADHLVVVGRGRVIADTSVASLIETASGGRVEVRTTARTEAMTVLAHAGATVAASGPDVLAVSGLSPEQIVAALTESHVPFGEVSAHRASLEEAYMELTRDSVEFRAEALS